MIEIVNTIIIISLIIIIYKYFEKTSYDVVMVKSNVNGREYLVRNLPDKQEAADLLGKMAVKAEKMVDIIKQMGYEGIYDKYMKADVMKETEVKIKDKDLIQGQNGGSSQTQLLEKEIKKQLKEDIERLVNNFDPDLFSENTPTNSYTSFTKNKQAMVYCLRDKKENEPLVKESIATFVMLHEISHIFTKEINHTPAFWNRFRLILRIGTDNGLYKPVDYSKENKEYCGVNVSSNPLFDKS